MNEIEIKQESIDDWIEEFLKIASAAEIKEFPRLHVMLVALLTTPIRMCIDERSVFVEYT
jgi:hypothetical protein